MVCKCGKTAVELPEASYASISDFEQVCNHCGRHMYITTDRGLVVDQKFPGVLSMNQVTDTDISSNIAEASACLQEAAISVNNGANRAAAVMARAALEVALFWAGFAEHNLADKVDHAVTSTSISNYDKQRAENVRLIGNFGAHGSSASYAPADAQMNQTDSKYVVELSSELIKKIVKWKKAGGNP